MSGGILYNLLIVLLSVEPSGTACKVCGSTVFRQSRPGANHQSPALIIGQMEMQNVEFVICHLVYQALNVRDGKEVTRHIEHHTSPAKPGHIPNGDTVHLPWARLLSVCFDRRRQELPDGLDAAKQRRWMQAPEENPIGFNKQFVAFFPKIRSRFIDCQENPVGGRSFSRQEGQFEAGGRSETIREEMPNEANFLPIRVNRNGRVGVERVVRSSKVLCQNRHAIRK